LKYLLKKIDKNLENPLTTVDIFVIIYIMGGFIFLKINSQISIIIFILYIMTKKREKVKENRNFF